MLEKQIEEFNKFVENYDMNNDNILRKYDHSFRVMNFSIEIAKDINLKEKQIELIGIIGLLHDIGRFEQWKKFNTYSDLNSVDHANLGVDILKNNDYINNYIQDENSKNIIFKAIYNHNKLKIEEDIDFNTEIICKIIRDADKLDIMQTQGNKEIPKNIKLNKEKIKNIYLKQCCINGKNADDVDIIIKILCFIFDLNFQYSFKYLQDENIIHDKIMLLKNNCSKDVNLDEIEKFLNEYINSKL